MSEEGSVLELLLHGPFVAKWCDGTEVRIKGAKQQAILALLACTPDQMRTRSWLQTMLWSRVDQKLGRASLRQALSSIKAEMGARFDAVFDVETDRIGLRKGAVTFAGGPERGEFLESLDIDEEGFEEWLRDMRAATPATVFATPRGAGPSFAPEPVLRPKIAVLPFVNYPRDPMHSYLGDAIAQELIRALSRSQMIDMISHLSSRSFDAQTVDIMGVRKALGVDYLVTGRCLISEDRLLIDVDFHDTTQGNLIWTERFEARTGDFFAGKADFIVNMALEIVRSVLAQSVELGSVRPLPNVSTHALMMSAISLMHHMASANFSRALEHLSEVTERAPNHSIPRAWRAQWFLLRVFQGWSNDLFADQEEAAKDTAQALQLNPACSFSLAIDANVKTVLKGDFDGASESFERALELNPSSAIACQLKSLMHSFKGEGREAVALSERARALSPCDPRSHFFDALAATAYIANGDYEEGVQLSEKSLRINPRHVSALRARVVGLEMLGRHGAARTAASALMQREPNLTVKAYIERHPAARSEIGKEWAKALGAAGVPAG